jgi:hypothetical protein
VCRWKAVIWTNTAPKLFSKKKVGSSGTYHVLRSVHTPVESRKKKYFFYGGGDTGSYVFMSTKGRIPVKNILG